MLEKDLQNRLLNWIRLKFDSKKIFIMKITPIPGIPQGCPDIIILYDGGFVAIEMKRSSKASFRPNQKYYLEMLNTFQNGESIVCYPENFNEVKNLLKNILRH